MNLKKLTALFLSAALFFSLSACSSGTSSGTGDAEKGSGAAGSTADEIRVNIWDNKQLDGLQQIADEWSEKSGIKVSIEVIEWDSYWTLLESGASGGVLPDVFWMHSNTAQLYMENDMLLALDDYIASDDETDLSDFYSGIVELYQSNGTTFALPKDHDTIALLYNEAIFEQYGVEVPSDDWSWENVEAAAAAISEASGGEVYGYAMDVSSKQDGWYNLVYGYGGEVITADHSGTTLDGDAAKQGMEMVRRLLRVSAPQSVVSETGTDSLFQSNKVAMTSQGSWTINSFYEAEFASDYKWAELPYCDANTNGQEDAGERVSCYNGLGWAIKADEEDPDSCYSLISYFCSETGQKRQAELGVTMAGRIGESSEFVNAFEGMDVSAFTKVEENGTLFFFPYTRNTTVWENAMQQTGAFLDAWQDPDSAEAMSDACDAAAEIIRTAIAEE